MVSACICCCEITFSNDTPCVGLQVGILVALLLTIAACVWLPSASWAVINSSIAATQCLSQNWAEIVTSRTIHEFMNTVDRNKQMLKSSVTTWATVETYATGTVPAAATYTSSLPAVTMGVLKTNPDVATLWTVFSTGEVFSAEWVTTSAQPVCRMYSKQSGLCHEANYSDTSGFGTFAQSSAGPLGVDCSSVTSASKIRARWRWRDRSRNLAVSRRASQEKCMM